MSEEEKKPEQKKEQNKSLIPWKVFLEEYPLNSTKKVSEFYVNTRRPHKPYRRNVPTLRLWCWDKNCHGIRNFRGVWENDSDVPAMEGRHYDFLRYICKDCETSIKTFCIISNIVLIKGYGIVTKIGEFPEQHIDIPSNLPNLMGEDSKTFIKGLKCEKQGLGIGAFSYYRRVVENQWTRLFNKIREASIRLDAPSEALGLLEEASKENQFSTAVDMIKDAIPQSLLVDTHNPLTLVHSALSAGLHEESDEKCLELAHSIRIILSALAENIKQALRDQSELKSAVSKLHKFKSSRGQSKKKRDS